MSTVHHEPPPPGETGRELTGSDAVAALHDALLTVTRPATKTMTVRDVDFKKVGRWTVMHAKLLDGKTVIEFDVRMPRARAESIRLRLSKVLS